jgi:carboxyl-terminal processing protease
MELQNKHRTKYEIAQPLILALMVVLGMVLGYKMNDKDQKFITKINGQTDIKIGRVEELIRFIESRYVDPLKRDSLEELAINGILHHLDPHSIYVPPSDVNNLQESMEGSFKGIGIETITVDDTVIIATLVKNSPAQLAGLKQYDKIIAINNTPVAGVKDAFNKVRTMLRTQTTSVQLEVKSVGAPSSLIKTVKLGDIPILSADVAYMLNDSVGYIEIKQFSSNTYEEFMKSLEMLVEKNKMKHLVLDMRGNPGGYLPQAVKIVNQLIREKDQLIVYTEGRRGIRQEYKTNGKTFFNIGKIAVLIDEYSASGSEVIAGAIQDLDRGIIVGRKSFGKGLVQEQFNLSNGGALRLTTARYFTPSGRSIQKSYASHDIYDSEVDNRSLATPSKPTTENKAYKTLYLGRKVYSGLGIDPEIFIPGDSTAHSPDYYTLLSHDMEYLVKRISLDKTILNKPTNIDALTNGYLSYLKAKKITISASPKVKAEAKKIIQNQIDYLSSNGADIEISKQKSASDAYIKAALGYAEGKVRLK